MERQSVPAIYRLLPILVLVLILGCMSVHARQADGDSVYLFITNSLQDEHGDAPPLDVAIDGKVVAHDLTWDSDFMDSAAVERLVAPGDHTFTASLSGGPTISASFEPIQSTLEAGNNYLLLATGLLSSGASSVSLNLIPLGAALSPGETAPGRIVVADLLAGVPAVNLAIDGDIVATDVLMNESVIVESPVDEFVQTTWIDPQTGETLVQVPPEEAFTTHIYDNTLTLLVLYGKFPGALHQTYESWVFTPIYIGEIKTVEGPDINLGDEVAVNLEAGQRIRYHLTLDKPTFLTIRLMGASADQDAYLRLYDSDGNLLSANDELSYSDQTYDAGLEGIHLQAGTYLIEAASWGDVFPGDFTLSVS